jgi:hypothetical protein
MGAARCGAVRFEVPDEFASMGFCHCTICKKISGGVGTANGRQRSDAIRILDGEELLTTYQPGEGSAKTFAPCAVPTCSPAAGRSRRRRASA